MAWRPYDNLIEGELDNTMLGKVTGWIAFYREGNEPLTVRLDLVGDFHEDIRGTRIRLRNPISQDRNDILECDGSYMEGFSEEQQGQVGDITAGLEVNGSYPYTVYPYIEWYSEANGRVVLELEPSHLEIVEDNRVTLSPLTDEERNTAQSKRDQAMGQFLDGLADDAEEAHGIRPITRVAHARKPKQK